MEELFRGFETLLGILVFGAGLVIGIPILIAIIGLLIYLWTR